MLETKEEADTMHNLVPGTVRVFTEEKPWHLASEPPNHGSPVLARQRRGDTEQMPLPFYGATIDVDGMRDPKCDWITYWGKATCVFDSVYRCYANVDGSLYIVEINVRAL